MSGKGKQKKTHDEFVKDVFEKVGTEYTVISVYKSANEYIQMRHNCDKCNNHEFPVKPGSFLYKTRCPECFGKKKKSTEKFKKEVYEKYGDEYKVIGEYTRSDEYIQIKHQCGKEYPVLPNALLQGNRCPDCGSASRVLNKTKTHEEFVQEVYDLVGNEYSIESEYTGAMNYINIKHLTCSYQYSSATPSSFLQGHRCPKCNETKGETKIDEILTKKDISHDKEYTFNDLRGLGGGLLRYDVPIFFDVEKTQLAGLIEYDGEFHYMAIKMGKDDTEELADKRYKTLKIHDKRKDDYCLAHSIPLLRIPYWEFDNIESIINNFIQELSQQDSSFLIAK